MVNKTMRDYVITGTIHGHEYYVSGGRHIPGIKNEVIVWTSEYDDALFGNERIQHSRIKEHIGERRVQMFNIRVEGWVSATDEDESRFNIRRI